MSSDSAPDKPARNLADAVRDVKIAHAERQDVIVDMKEADRARLELLAQELQPLFDEVPDDDDQFDFAISSGLQPRLWIDAVAHVQMGRDRRTYRFVLDTRYGRTVLAETSDMMEMADQVTIYVAERTVERQRFLSGAEDRNRPAPARPAGPAKGAVPEHQPQPVAAAKPVAEARPAAVAEQKSRPAGSGLVVGLVWFIIGCVATTLIFMLLFGDRIGPSAAGL